MISTFYRTYSRALLWMLVLSFPWLFSVAYGVRSNNDIETWLPEDSQARRLYEEFKLDFGVEEVLVVGFESAAVGPELREAVASRIETLEGVRQCVTSERMARFMQELGADAPEAGARWEGLMESQGGELSAVIVALNEYGTAHRAETVGQVRGVLDYCRLERPEVLFTGSPVLITELDRLGSPEASTRFFALTLLISLGLLKYSTGHWKISFALLGVTLWTISTTKALIVLCGGEMNFIMGALSVMVMIFTLSIAVHYLGYYRSAQQAGDVDALVTALRESWRPCFLSTLTTLLGLLSLNVSDILPVRQFGYAAGLGAVVAMVTGLGVTPALVLLWPNFNRQVERRWFDFSAWGTRVAYRKWSVLSTACIAAVAFGWGLSQLHPDIDPVAFLPSTNPVAEDLRRVERELTSVGSIEAVVDFGTGEDAFVERMLEVRRLQRQIEAHPQVRHTLSAASLFPEQLPDSPLACAQMLNRAREQQSEQNYVARGQRLWRISVRMDADADPDDICDQLKTAVDDERVTWTGVSPLIADAQDEIFLGYWQSFTAALLTITLVMIIALRSIPRGLIAMVPNVLPVWLVFGIVGFFGMPIDIGMMMTGSIALGISVDCTFHFLVKYDERVRQGLCATEACKQALEHTGKPLIESTIISSIGMLALCLSSFTPTSRFGWLMASQMSASLLGELVMLPALLCAAESIRRRLRRGERTVEPIVPETCERAYHERDVRVEGPHVLPQPRRRAGKEAGAAQYGSRPR